MLPALLSLSAPSSPFVAVLIMAVILFGFQTAIGNIQTLPSDLFRGKSVGTLSGLAGMCAKFAAAGLTWYIGSQLPADKYGMVFLIGAGLVGIVIFAVWVLVPKIEPVSIEN
jgi:ACS family hexuronate transporter-like MFS transporter